MDHPETDNLKLPVDSVISSLTGVEYVGEIDGTLPAGTIIKVITTEQFEHLKPMLLSNGLIAFDEINSEIHLKPPEEHILPDELKNEHELIQKKPIIEQTRIDSPPPSNKRTCALAKAAKMDVLPVKCKDILGQLHMDKFGSGSRGKCIKYMSDWFTPREFEIKCGRSSSKDWKRTIKFDDLKLDELIKAGVMSTHSLSCTCGTCHNDESALGPIRLDLPWKKRKSRNSVQQELKNSNSRKTKVKDCPKSNRHSRDVQMSDSMNADSSSIESVRNPSLANTLKRLDNISQTLIHLTTELKRCVADVNVIRARQLRKLGQKHVTYSVISSIQKDQVLRTQTENSVNETNLASDLISVAYSGA